MVGGLEARKAELEDGVHVKKLLSNALHVLPAQDSHKLDPTYCMYEYFYFMKVEKNL